IARKLLTLVMDDGEKLMADKAYIGDTHFLAPFKPSRTPTEEVFNAYHNALRQMVERLIRRIKIFRAVKEVWRHDLALHKKVFFVVCQITNLLLITDNPL